MAWQGQEVGDVFSQSLKGISESYTVGDFIVNPANEDEVVILFSDTSSETYKIGKYAIM